MEITKDSQVWTRWSKNNPRRVQVKCQGNREWVWTAWPGKQLASWTQSSQALQILCALACIQLDIARATEVFISFLSPYSRVSLCSRFYSVFCLEEWSIYEFKLLREWSLPSKRWLWYSKHVVRLLHRSLAVLAWGMDETVHMEDSFLLVLSECSQSYLAILKLLLRSLPKDMHRGRPGICNCHLKVK